MSENKVFYSLVAGRELVVEIGQVAKQAFVFFSSSRRHTILQGDWVQTCALPICGSTTHVQRLIRGRSSMLSNAIADDQTHQQLQALRQANRVRLARAELKRKVASGEASVAEIVDRKSGG